MYKNKTTALLQFTAKLDHISWVSSYTLCLVTLVVKGTDYIPVRRYEDGNPTIKQSKSQWPLVVNSYNDLWLLIVTTDRLLHKSILQICIHLLGIVYIFYFFFWESYKYIVAIYPITLRHVIHVLSTMASQSFKKNYDTNSFNFHKLLEYV